MEGVKKLRSTIKAKFTRIGIYIDKISDGNTPSEDELKSRLEYLEATWSDY